MGKSTSDSPPTEFDLKLEIKLAETDGVGGGHAWRLSERTEQDLKDSLQSLINKLNYQLTNQQIRAAQQSAARPSTVAVVTPQFTIKSSRPACWQSNAPLIPPQTRRHSSGIRLNRSNNFGRQSTIITPNTDIGDNLTASLDITNNGPPITQSINRYYFTSPTPILPDRRTIRPFGSVRSNLLPYLPPTASSDATNNGPPIAQSIKRYYFRPHILNEISNEGSKWTCSSRTTVATPTSTNWPAIDRRQSVSTIMTATTTGAHTLEFGVNGNNISEKVRTEAENNSNNTKSLMMIEEQRNVISQAVNNKKYYFKRYPKYSIVHEIQKPTIIPSLSDNREIREFNFNLRFPLNDWSDDSPISLSLLRSNSLQVQLRFCDLKDINVDEQRDCCFEHLCIDINGEKLYRYSETGDRCEPFDITKLCRFDSGVEKNEICFWLDEPNSEWPFLCVYEVSIVMRKTADNFLSDLKQNISQNLQSLHTKSLINERLHSTQDSEVTLSDSSIKIKLSCPLSCVRLVTPCRTIHCKHIECFDAFSFFKVNDVKYDWLCPLCHTSATYEMLRIDGLFTEILQNTDTNCMEVVFKSDNTWEPIIENREENENLIELEENEDERESIDKLTV